MTRHHLSQIETGKKWPSVKALFSVAARLDVHVFELMLIDDEERAVIAEMVRALPSHRRTALAAALEREPKVS